MIELFALYKYAFILCFLASLTLCLQGSHLVARRESLQILALAQGALLGNLIGRLAFNEGEIATILSSLICFILLKVFFVSMSKNLKNGETFFIVAYLSLLSVSYLLISIFPGLEGHMSVGFFGDIVSVTGGMTFVLIGTFSVLFILLGVFHKQLLRRTIEKSVLGIGKFSVLEELLFAGVFVCSLYGLGFLFSVTTMIFPVVIIGTKGKSLKSLLICSLSVSAIASISGLGLSIGFERLSTVPTQVLMMLSLLVLVGLVMGKSNNKVS
jgi:ABC-type Mn2+/Zn2+ transport system permease subunit